jgi:hypothetical protein
VLAATPIRGTSVDSNHSNTRVDSNHSNTRVDSNHSNTRAPHRCCLNHTTTALSWAAGIGLIAPIAGFVLVHCVSSCSWHVCMCKGLQGLYTCVTHTHALAASVQPTWQLHATVGRRAAKDRVRIPPALLCTSFPARLSLCRQCRLSPAFPCVPVACPCVLVACPCVPVSCL